MKNFIKENKFYLWIIAILGFAIYSKSLFNGFVWDDKVYFTYLALHPIGDVFFYFTNPLGFFYRPLVFVFLIPIYNIFGASGFWFHLAQLFLHLADTMLIFIFLRLFIKSSFSFLLALIFLVHPMNVEAVAYISAISENLFIFFGLSALLWAIYSELKTSKDKIAVCILLYCSMASKETGLLFLILLILYSFIEKKKYAKSTLGISFLAAIPYILGRIIVPISYHFSLVPIVKASFIERLNTIPSIILFYFKTFLWPRNLAIDQNWVVLKRSFANFYIPLFIDIAIIIVFLSFARYVYNRHREKFKTLIFFYLWLGLGMGLLLQIVPIDMTVAERWFYFTMVGLLGIIGVALEAFINTKIKIKWLYLGVIILLIPLSIKAVNRSMDWHDEITLYSHDESISTESFTIETGLGLNYILQNNLDQAQEHLQKSLNIAQDEGNLFNMGAVYELKGNKERAEIYYQEAVDHYTGFISPEIFSTMLINHRAFGVADDFLSKQLAKNPDNLNLVYFRSISLYELERKDEALPLMKRVMLNNYPNDFYNALYGAMSQGLNIDNFIKRGPAFNH